MTEYRVVDNPTGLQVGRVYLECGSKYTLFHSDEIHSFDDKPAVILPNGDMLWAQYGKYHRDNDLPAVVRKNGNLLWYQAGVCHRDKNEPAIVYADGRYEWYEYGIEIDPIIIMETRLRWGQSICEYLLHKDFALRDAAIKALKIFEEEKANGKRYSV